MLFISYRRQDSGTIARRTADYLAQLFGPQEVFIDTDRIRLGEHWSAQIRDALERCNLLIAVIGPQWLRLQDEYGRRRIDQEKDWVREEIEFALRKRIPVLPLFVSGAVVPPREAFPDSIQDLHDCQAYWLNDEHWKEQIAGLVNRLVPLGYRPSGAAMNSDLVFPPKFDTSQPLNETELNEALARLPGWKIVTRPGVEDSPERTELYKAFRFKSYPDAMHFMLTASRFIQATDHHPDWQNLWVSVRIWITTWDIGHKPSFKDTRLAEYLETLYQGYKI